MIRMRTPVPSPLRQFATPLNGLLIFIAVVLGWLLRTQAWRIKRGSLRLLGMIDPLLVLKWWAIVVVASFLGICLILSCDWFFYRRLPFARWRVSQDTSTRETNIIREAVRLRRIRDALSRGVDRKDTTE
ncbi:MAG: hypothetical protein JWN86_203 [Planctomycetota bacterium]|nr:hypothetical protein [Planctomycetota bacterium]